MGIVIGDGNGEGIADMPPDVTTTSRRAGFARRNPVTS